MNDAQFNPIPVDRRSCEDGWQVFIQHTPEFGGVSLAAAQRMGRLLFIAEDSSMNDGSTGWIRVPDDMAPQLEFDSAVEVARRYASHVAACQDVRVRDGVFMVNAEGNRVIPIDPDTRIIRGEII